MQHAPSAPMRTARVLLLTPDSYGSDMDAYLSQICESGPFFADPDFLAGEDVSSTPAALTVSIKRSYHCTLPCTSTPSETVLMDIDLILLPSVSDVLSRILTPAFLASYQGVVLGVSASSTSNDSIDPIHFSTHLPAALRDDFFMPIVSHIRKLSGDQGPEIPITVLVIGVSDVVYATVGWDLFRLFRDWMAASATFGSIPINATDVVVDTLQFSHLPWVLLARMIAFNVSLKFGPPKALEAFVLQCNMAENEQHQTEQRVRNQEFDARRQASTVVDDGVWNFQVGDDMDLGGGGGGGGEPPSYNQPRGGELSPGRRSTHDIFSHDASSSRRVRMNSPHQDDGPASSSSQNNQRQKRALQQILDRFDSFEDTLTRMETKQDSLMEQVEYLQTQLQDQDEKSDRQAKLIRKMAKKLRQFMQDEEEEDVGDDIVQLDM